MDFPKTSGLAFCHIFFVRVLHDPPSTRSSRFVDLNLLSCFRNSSNDYRIFVVRISKDDTVIFRLVISEWTRRECGHTRYLTTIIKLGVRVMVVFFGLESRVLRERERAKIRSSKREKDGNFVLFELFWCSLSRSYL